MNLKKKNLLVIIFSFSIMLVMIPDLDYSLGDSEPITTIKLSWDQDDWHEGTNQSTSELDLVYTETYDKFEWDNDGNEDDGVLVQQMKISYKDGTDTKIWFAFSHLFNQSNGIDVENRNVTDWNERDDVHSELGTRNKFPPEYNLGSDQTLELLTQTEFGRFQIYNGTSADLNISKTEEYPNSWEWHVDEQDWIADLNFRNSSMRIGQVTLDTEDYSSNGSASIKSIVKFNVHINATIGLETNKGRGIKQNKTVINAVLSYTINHTVDYTKMKYGLEIDWSNAKDFPTFRGYVKIKDGDPYCLLLKQRPHIMELEGEIGTFGTNDENDTAIYKKNGHLLFEHKAVKNYNLTAESTLKNTTRIYYEVAGYDADENRNYSKILVFFDGFTYNQSTGFECDPMYIMYSGVSSSKGGWIPGYDLFILLGFLSVATILIYKRRKNSKFKLESH